MPPRGVSFDERVGLAWAGTNINGTIFRRDPITSIADRQVVSYYDAQGQLVLADRTIGRPGWRLNVTRHVAKVRDAHNGVSIMFDDIGRLHCSFDHHATPLKYAVADPGTTQLSEIWPMTGSDESRVTYPEFYPMPGGSMLFLYRSGGSGDGSLVVNRLDPGSDQWTRVQVCLIAGEGACNAYWQAHIDLSGMIHLSWTWRATPNAATNQDICYARSADHGQTWQRSDGSAQRVPITRANAEIIAPISQGRDLINSTTMTVLPDGRPVIATYWRPEGASAPQYMLVMQGDEGWSARQIGMRNGDFVLGGVGSRAIPIARPLVVSNGDKTAVFIRDCMANGRLTVLKTGNIDSGNWETEDVTDDDVGFLEPNLDRRRLRATGEVHLYVQRTEQLQGEISGSLGAQDVRVVQWNGWR